MKVLVTADIDKRIEKEFSKLEFHYMGYALDPYIPSTHEEIKKAIPNYDFLISEFDTIDKDIIDAASKLKMIICCRGGVHTVIDVAYAAQKGILVKNTPARNASSVAEYVLGVIFSADRNLYQANCLVLSDTLQKEHFVLPAKYRDSLWGMDSNSPYHVFRGKGMHNFTLGVIGYGNVGRVVVKDAVLLGIHVLVYNHHPILSPIPAGVEVVDEDYLLKNSDFISLHCNNRNHQVVIGENEFFKMKKGAYFINTARGDLVDENALIKYLNNMHLKGAALDVTKKEPLPPNSPLIKAKNIFITPHIAGATDEVIETGTDMAIYHLREYLDDTLGEDYE
jgi:D-3-phosphoglycerate dehydrogenase